MSKIPVIKTEDKKPNFTAPTIPMRGGKRAYIIDKIKPKSAILNAKFINLSIARECFPGIA